MTAKLPSPVLGIRAYGAVTNIGNSANQTAASWVARTRRLRRVKLEGFAEPFTLADNPRVTEGKEGAERLFALLESAVAEALDHQPCPCPDATVNRLNLLALPQWLEAQACQQLTHRLSDFWPERHVIFKAITGSSTAAWSALMAAYNAIDADPKLQQVVIATVDSLCEPSVLNQTADEEQLLQANNSQGYIPGEAAVCIVLERLSDITKLPADRFALHRPVLVRQKKTWWPSAHKPNPKALSSVLSSALEQAGMSPRHISHLLSDMDGSSWRAQIEGAALDRAVFSKTSALPHWRPATLLGQTGTTTGTLGWILVALMQTSHIEPVNTVLNWSIAPDGKTAACVLERSPMTD